MLAQSFVHCAEGRASHAERNSLKKTLEKKNNKRYLLCSESVIKSERVFLLCKKITGHGLLHCTANPPLKFAFMLLNIFLYFISTNLIFLKVFYKVAVASPGVKIFFLPT